MIASYSNPCPICGEERIEKFHLYFDGAIKLFRCSNGGFVGHFPGPGTFRAPGYSDSDAASALPDMERRYTARAPKNAADIIARIRKHCSPPARVCMSVAVAVFS
jgi:hypothetical protein